MHTRPKYALFLHPLLNNWITLLLLVIPFVNFLQVHRVCPIRHSYIGGSRRRGQPFQVISRTRRLVLPSFRLWLDGATRVHTGLVGAQLHKVQQRPDDFDSAFPSTKNLFARRYSVIQGTTPNILTDGNTYESFNFQIITRRGAMRGSMVHWSLVGQK